MGTIEVISAVTYLFFVALLVALFVERLLEVLVAIYKYLEWRRGGAAFWNRFSARLAQRLQAFVRYQQATSPLLAQAALQVFQRFLGSSGHPGEPWEVSAARVRQAGIRAVVRLLAFLISLVLVLSLKLDLVALVVHVLKLLYPWGSYLESITADGWVHYLLTAIVISMGTEPLHTLIVRFERLNERARQKQQKEQA